MNGSAVLAGVGALLGGVALAVAVADGQRGQHAASAPLEVDLAPQLAQLRAENERLRERLEALEARELAPLTRARSPVDVVTGEELAALRAELLARIDAETRPLGEREFASPEKLDSLVAESLASLRKQEQVDKVRGGLEQRQQQLEATLPKVRDWLELTPQQSDSMRAALQARYDREAELVRQWEAGVDEEALGQQKNADAEAHRRDVEAFLTPEQIERYRSRGGK